MSVINTVMDLQSTSALLDLKNTERKAGGDMGKHDFLMLLAAQLRYQDPMEPKNDSDFAAGLAQFSALEQMQNMSSSLESMNNMQSYGLIGKYVLAEAFVDGKYQEVTGVVDSIFTKNGVMMAQVGEYMIPLSSIKEVFDTANLLTSEMLMTTSQSLIGRMVIAEVDGEEIEGIVTRILVDKGVMLAQIDDGTNDPKFVPVNTIVDIREVGSKKHTPKPEKPPEAKNIKPDGKGGFIEVCENNVKELGLWTWDENQWKWVYTSFDKSDEVTGEETVPGEEPGTGEETIPGEDQGENELAA